MPTYTIFRENKFKSIISGPDDSILELNIEDGDESIEGEYAQDDYYIINSNFYPYPPRPNYPHIFNLETEEWDWDEDTSWAELRFDRDQKLLTEIDPIVTNPLRWSSLSETQQEAYATYRQELLDLPDNTTDPRNPVWPTPPQ
jgi:hypothetical protein